MISTLLLGGAIVWDLFWTGWSLWIAAVRRDRAWYVALFIVHTIGLANIFYMVTRGPKHIKRAVR